MAYEANTNMGHSQNDTGREKWGKMLYAKKNLFRYHFVHHKSHKDWNGIKSEPLW
jgi:hypothetical protein